MILDRLKVLVVEAVEIVLDLKIVALTSDFQLFLVQLLERQRILSVLLLRFPRYQTLMLRFFLSFSWKALLLVVEVVRVV